MEKWFGRTYEKTGSIDCDLILKTRGEIKIQIGNRFIDLIKNGKVVSQSGYFSKVTSIDQIKSNGIYICDNIIYVKIDDQLIQVGGNENQTYVSFLSQQEINSAQKDIAKRNIGLQFDSISDALNEVEKGLVFIGDKIFYVSGGTYTEYGGIPNPYNKQFVIAKDTPELGALKLVGNGRQNGIVINEASAYEDNGTLYINSNTKLSFIINGVQAILANAYQAEFSIPIVVNEGITSNDYSYDRSGFSLTSNGNESTLEVDNVIERKWDTIVYIIDNSSNEGIAITNSIKNNGIYIKAIDFNDQVIDVFPILHVPLIGYTRMIDSNDYQKITYELLQGKDFYYRMKLEFNIYDVQNLKFLGVYYGSDYQPLPFYTTKTYGIYHEDPINNAQESEEEEEEEQG